jgi:hypothetical protein
MLTLWKNLIGAWRRQVAELNAKMDQFDRTYTPGP